MAKQNAIQDNQLNRALIAHSGTADDADTIRLIADADGKLETTASVGDITVGTIDNVASGSVVVTAGSVIVSDGTIVTTMGDLTGGTIDAIKAGTLTIGDGTITTILAGTQELLGTVNTVGTVNVLKDGTIGEIGTVTGIGVLADGTISEVGTVAGVGVLADGTISEVGTVTGIGVLADGTISEVGTVTGVGVLALGTVKVTEGSADVTALGGTIENLDSGTVVVGGGTVQINPKSPTSLITYGTLLAGAGQTWATISAASGAGTYHYVQGAAITVHSGTVDSFIGFGSALVGTNVIARGAFPEGGGIARNFSPSPLAGSGTNTELICEIGGAGTVNFTVDFWRGT